jgi:hypothetical protein
LEQGFDFEEGFDLNKQDADIVDFLAVFGLYYCFESKNQAKDRRADKDNNNHTLSPPKHKIGKF